jgi:hypothetical protein
VNYWVSHSPIRRGPLLGRAIGLQFRKGGAKAGERDNTPDLACLVVAIYGAHLN